MAPGFRGDATVEADALLDRFEAGLLDPSGFSHRDHLRVGYELLKRERFIDAAARMSAGLRRMLARIGRPDAYHETITIGFLALIAERVDDGAEGFEAFVARHPELLDRDALRRVYGSERLALPVARRTFVLPG